MSRRWLMGVYLLGLAAAVGAALWLHRHGEPAGPSLGDDGRYHPPATGPGPVTGEAVLAPLGFTVLAELPADLAMPAGAVRRSVISRRVFGAEQIKAEYAVIGEVEHAAAEMAERLNLLGWRNVEQAVAPGQVGAGRWLNYRKSADTMTVHLNGDGVWVKIIAVIQRAESAGDEKP